MIKKGNDLQLLAALNAAKKTHSVKTSIEPNAQLHPRRTACGAAPQISSGAPQMQRPTVAAKKRNRDSVKGSIGSLSRLACAVPPPLR